MTNNLKRCEPLNARQFQLESWMLNDACLELDQGDTATFEGHAIANHFPDVGKMIWPGKERLREIDNVMLAHYICGSMISLSHDHKNSFSNIIASEDGK